MDPSKQRDLQHVGLPTACAVIYAKVTGAIPDPRKPVEMEATLNDVAHALSNLVPIYAAHSGSAMPTELAAIDLIQGKFSRGASAFTHKSGEEVHGLTVRRGDMMNALKILMSAHITFRQPGEGGR